jgi:hypothetical protein
MISFLSMKHPFFFVLSLLWVAAFGLASCDFEQDPATEMRLCVNGETYTIALPAEEPVDLITLNTEFDTDIQILNPWQFRDVHICGVLIKHGICKLRVPELSADRRIDISYTTGGEAGTVLLNTLNSGIPPVVAEGKAEIDGDFYLSFIFRRLIQKYDNEGRMLFYRFDPSEKDGTMDETGYWDFKKHHLNGKTYYSYHAPDPAFADRAFTGYNPGMRVLLDAHYRPVKTIHGLASRDGYLPAGQPIDGHDFHFFTPDHYILSMYNERTINGKKLCVAYLQEVKDGNVVFDWWSSDHPEMVPWASPVFDTSYDCVHLNCIQVLPDGNLLCSLRHLSSVVKIDRAGGTGQIIWRVAGEELPEEQGFCGQHYVTLHKDGSLTLFDNGNGHTPPCSHIRRLRIDPATGEVLVGGDMRQSPDDYFSMACGAVNYFEGPFSVGWGWCSQDRDNNRLVTEFDAQGREIFSLRHDGSNYLVNSLNSSYRCVKF